MSNTETLDDLYKSRWLPQGLNSEVGRYNVLRLEPVLQNNPKPPPYCRRTYYKISLLTGSCIMKYGDQIIKIKKQALVFTNPLVPYGWEKINSPPNGFASIFDQKFFQPFGELSRYPVFQQGTNPVFELSDEQLQQVTFLYERMLEEIDTDYIYKYDLLRALILELIHFALKLSPNNNLSSQHINGPSRITAIFMELLERQFPIDDIKQTFILRSATDYAQKIHVHVNYLNRAVKKVTGKTTTQHIAERVLQEAKILLRNTKWNVSEIAYLLGFTEISHFNNFFKKQVELSPLKYRRV